MNFDPRQSRPAPASLLAFAKDKLDALDAATRRRRFSPTTRKPAGEAARDGRQLVSFSCNDYLGLSHDPRVVRAAQDAAAAYGAGAGASRLVTGDYPLLHQLERRLAALKGTESALVFGSGMLTNIGVIPALIGEGGVIVMDELSHSCIHSGARLSGAQVEIFSHNDAAHAQDILSRHMDAPRKLVITETVFSMDGDRAPLDALYEISRQHDAWLMTDDAHGFGLADMPANPAPLQMGTLSKSLGSYGGYLCAPEPVVDLLTSRARTLIYSTALPPASAGAALAALDIIESEPERCARPLNLARRFTRALDLPGPQSAIAPIILGTEERALEASAALSERGFLVIAIRPPTVPVGAARLRFTFSASHTDDDVERLIEATRKALAP